MLFSGFPNLGHAYYNSHMCVRVCACVCACTYVHMCTLGVVYEGQLLMWYASSCESVYLDLFSPSVFSVIYFFFPVREGTYCGPASSA